eukprot:SAG31_NODE_268_length_18767_cov_4.644900_9_plen_148_part_00
MISPSKGPWSEEEDAKLRKKARRHPWCQPLDRHRSTCMQGRSNDEFRQRCTTANETYRIVCGSEFFWKKYYVDSKKDSELISKRVARICGFILNKPTKFSMTAPAPRAGPEFRPSGTLPEPANPRPIRWPHVPNTNLNSRSKFINST